MSLKISFVWSVDINSALRKEAEGKIVRDIYDTFQTDFCHDGDIVVELHSSDPLRISASGVIKCGCGKTWYRLCGASDMSSVRYEKVG